VIAGILAVHFGPSNALMISGAIAAVDRTSPTLRINNSDDAT
jgi:hypothetical protein